jgi:hypothetical protein
LTGVEEILAMRSVSLSSCRLVSRWIVAVGALATLACGGRRESLEAEDASPALDAKDASPESGARDAALAEVTPDTSAPDVLADVADVADGASAPNACAGRCFADASIEDFALRASSCICAQCHACGQGEMCGGPNTPTDACVRCFSGLFGAGGACTSDANYRMACDQVDHCKATSDCLRGCGGSLPR